MSDKLHLREYIMPGYPSDPGETIMGALHMPSYELEDNSMVIHDAVWGDCSIGDRQPYDSLLMELARSPLFRRLQAVEQLTLPPSFLRCPTQPSSPGGNTSGEAWLLCGK